MAKDEITIGRKRKVVALDRYAGEWVAFLDGKVIAHQGSFQQMQGSRVAQLLHITLDSALPCIPEVSANKYVLNIRFVAANYVAKSAVYDQDVAFNLTFCAL